MMKRQTGFSLIELMVAMTIGLFVLAGVTKIFFDSRGSDRLREGISDTQTNGRIALDLLGQDIERAGYKTPKAIDSTLTLNNVGVNQSDTISITYKGANDCLGDATPAGVVVNRYFIGNNTSGNANDPKQLFCDGNGNSADSGQPILEGIDTMQILYGLDLDHDGYSETYKNAAALNTTDWFVITSVKVGMLASSANNARGAGEEDTATYRILDQDFTASTGDRRKIRQVMVKTIPIRNAMYQNRTGG